MERLFGAPDRGTPDAGNLGAVRDLGAPPVVPAHADGDARCAPSPAPRTASTRRVSRLDSGDGCSRGWRRRGGTAARAQGGCAVGGATAHAAATGAVGATQRR